MQRQTFFGILFLLIIILLIGIEYLSTLKVVKQTYEMYPPIDYNTSAINDTAVDYDYYDTLIRTNINF